ncbi:MAG: carbohydrate porin [Burkholderiales bacterium]|nr:carbohydrate porin [Burkholderiales bacterium]MDE2075590.1 carbohydrate porin [Burkholderiales bacterium]MDE2432886.1 carbohydrate porin [Burkholderiales bacterium]
MRFKFLNERQLGSSLLRLVALLAGALAGVSHAADTVAPESWNLKFQSTYVWQEKSPFSASYSGANSLSTNQERSYSFTATAALGFRPWAGSEFYVDPEAAQGVPLSNLTGLGGFTNGEMARSSGPTLKIYRARAFLRQTWGDGGEQEAVESAANQLAGMVDKRRWVLTAGNLSVIDIFDANIYNHDPRTQFLNWSVMTHGAFDYAGDARGYSWGLVLERYHDDWVIRAGRFIEPKEPNQQDLDDRLFKHYGDQIELEHAHELGGQPGKLRLLAFRNRTKMSRYQDALDQSAKTGAAPDINAVRTGDQVKYGLGLNLEQAISPDIGLFARGNWADGATETYAFTEIDRSISAGTLIKGARWGRGQDSVGLAFARNGLSQAHRSYLAQGGYGFFIGDGKLRYKPETIVEGFYDLSLCKAAWISLDWQRIFNPAYNADRGPVSVATLRFHTEF